MLIPLVLNYLFLETFLINNSKSHFLVCKGSASYIKSNFCLKDNFIFKELIINLNSLTGTVVSSVILTSADNKASHKEIPLSFKVPLT